MLIGEWVPILTRNRELFIVQSLVLSHLNYCLSNWATTASLIGKALKLKKFAARIAVGGIKKFDNVSPAFKKWLKIIQKHTYDMVMFEIINTVYLDWLYSFPSIQESIASFTRQQKNFVAPLLKTDTGAREFAASRPKTWNSFPFSITSTPSHGSFNLN